MSTEKEEEEPKHISDRKLALKLYESSKQYKHKCFFNKVASCKLTKITDISDPASELCLESAVLEAQESVQCIVVEDDFVERIEGDYSWKILQKAGEEKDPKGHERFHLPAAEKNFSYFVDKGLSKDDARACAYALSFYTGYEYHSVHVAAGSTLHVRGASKGIRKGNTDVKNTQLLPVMYYLIKALSCIPMHWGICCRAIQLTPEEVEQYQPGTVFSWLQFASSKAGQSPASDFQDRNCLFFLFSQTGRRIHQFSNYPKEDEVLFLPHSCFILTRRQSIVENGKQSWVFHARQVELGFSKKVVLWVDDRIFEPEYENKKHIEWAAAQGLSQNTHFILKNCTEHAISFLRSPFGKNLREKDFKIVTDMERKNERISAGAGAVLVKMVRELAIENSILIFTSSTQRAETQLNQYHSTKDRKGLRIATAVSGLIEYIK